MKLVEIFTAWVSQAKELKLDKVSFNRKLQTVMSVYTRKPLSVSEDDRQRKTK